ncbi:Hsp20/alpha crystallin family protein [Bacillus cytotoxicus]|uniref:Hsp20/alpha crystallin family protein n=1 Tax=Bacillus cytotoxicus TaxID=580165 RepID=UPI00086406AA|nr:Hsp20/alpha crystallin family protein [Bacillus cytotoxicus]AWC29177.1 Hsp20/alpha crystallin family protein [Bacillus cytotoxicus]AWC41302.1 Hsp20/alpha crystallin family protein [Bacillus cytotoxicus]AWC49233.1 Hsp20/alpha crystallin family protein [Bacillus cytotoxicus]AWC53248.1 Hsp20/alpha crystallin family protein [Bacillus cytotoxicus]AWC57376.1 Hsp20/alpha crystallin family protein [Bacillus cytotoxicus]
MSKKKKNCLFRVDGFEEWMDQFCSGSYLNCNFPNYIHIDLCETEQEYILETDVPNVTEQNVFIKKMETGLNICISKKNVPLQRTIFLPASIVYKKMIACIENGFLSIHISKNEIANPHEKKVLFSNEY